MNFENLTEGELISETRFLTVVKVGSEKVQVRTKDGVDVILQKDYVEKLNSADQYSKEEKITRTEMQEILLRSINVALTVNYNKKVDEKIAKKLLSEVNGKSLSPVALKKLAKDVTVGPERVMVGYHLGYTHDTGRLKFYDQEANFMMKQVDPRTLNWIIVGDVKYTLKK